MELHINEYRANSDLPEGSPGKTSMRARPFLEIRTCQRTLKISTSPLESDPACRRAFSGVEAYDFLLRFASGLESEIKGETDVFGQVKTAFKELSSSDPEAAQSLSPLFQTLLEDTKEIRAQYLQGIGGNTYGALARRVLSPGPSSRVLIIGAGQIAKSVAPYFADSKLAIYNRTPERLSDLAADLAKKGYRELRFLGPEADLGHEIRHADLILLATPPGSEVEADLLRLASSTARILHLGGKAEDLRLPLQENLLTLTDLFALERDQSTLRERRIEKAFEACRRRALLRSLSRSIHIHHGWEDLALFY
jgi:hypothetical protein